MKTILNFIKSLKFIFNIDYWSLNYQYSKAWDDKLNELLDKYKFEKIDSYEAKLGNTVLWITNHPYASFHLKVGEIGFRPSRLTIQRAHNILNSKVKPTEQELNDIISKIN